MFEQTFIATRAGARRPGPMAASLALQTALVASVLALPLFQTVVVAWRPPGPIVFVPVKPKVVEVVQRQIASRQTVNLRPIFHPSFIAPTRIPEKISESGPEPAPFMPQGAGTGSYADPLANIRETVETPKTVPERETVAAAPKGPMRVSVGVQAAKLIRQVKPVYPQLARAARMSGTVRLQAIIATDGRIRNLQLIGGPPLLVKAALEAVKEWQYEPTLLNGEPVEVITSIEVNFTLSQ
jgi:protein TonB